jgi:hypothetical protein
MKILYGLVLILMLCGCTASNEDVTANFKMPNELSNYKIIRLNSEGPINLYVLVKTHENREVIGTSTSEKSPIHTVVIDDKEYVEKER